MFSFQAFGIFLSDFGDLFEPLMKSLKNIFCYPFVSVLSNILLVLVAYFICRAAFTLMNIELMHKVTFARFFILEFHSLRFDLSGIVYSNLPYLVLALIPFGFRYDKTYQNLLKWLFVITNALWITVNLADAVFFQYTEKRTTFSFFSEFRAESNLAGIFFIELKSHWYLVLLAAVIITGFIKLYRVPAPAEAHKKFKFTDYLLHTLMFLLTGVLALGGIRGSYNYEERPLQLVNATEYVEDPVETGIVLNTTFCMFRTVQNDSFIVPEYFITARQRDEMTGLFNPVHRNPDAVFTPRNVVVFILESFSSCYSEYLSSLQGSPHQGDMPFLDSLMHESLHFRYSFANGHFSIEAIPSAICGLPSLIEPIYATQYVSNRFTSLATHLGGKGYYTAFFHGAPAGSMGLTSFARSIGYEHLYALEDYPDKDDYDGTWAIWDDRFIDYMGEELSAIDGPFLATIFTATSHHPFRIPERMEDEFPEGPFPISKCVRYVDDAIRGFMTRYSKEDWFGNTLFVFTADHTGPFSHNDYLSTSGSVLIPIFFYAPDGGLKHLDEGIAQQTDITPTVLGYLGYEQPYLSFGNNLLDATPADRFALSYSGGMYHFIKGDWLMLFNGEKVIGLYNYKRDCLQQNNLAQTNRDVIDSMLPQLKAILQQYVERITTNTLDNY